MTASKILMDLSRRNECEQGHSVAASERLSELSLEVKTEPVCRLDIMSVIESNLVKTVFNS